MHTNSTSDSVYMLLQATVRAPAARNMITKTLPFNYLVGSVPFLFLSFVGYWAYGNEVGYNILYSSSGPKWAIALAYVCAAVQIIVSFHVSHWSWPAYLLKFCYSAGCSSYADHRLIPCELLTSPLHALEQVAH